MTQVLEASLNTGTIFAQRQIGKDLFRKYVEDFGFGKKDRNRRDARREGQRFISWRKRKYFRGYRFIRAGITVTPIQLLTGFAALGNGGKLFKPYVVSEILYPDGTREKTKPIEVAKPIDARTSRLISGMLVSVVENGHGKRAGVPGYWVAGKTGTAQVAKKDGAGYEEDETIGSFCGICSGKRSEIRNASKNRSPARRAMGGILGSSVIRNHGKVFAELSTSTAGKTRGKR